MPRVVVITGSTEGIGFALAKRFLLDGDSVMISSRSAAKIDAALAKLQPLGSVAGQRCDVTVEADLDRLLSTAAGRFGRVDIVIANAGVSYTTHAPLASTPATELARVLNTNLLGAMLTAKAAIGAFRETPRLASAPPPSLVFMDGAGSNGMATAAFLAYGASKAALPQLAHTLRVELGSDDLAPVLVNVVSPGMVLTRLLLGYDGGRALSAKRAFNILAETPPTVAAWLVPIIRGFTASGGYAKYLTAVGAAWRFATFWRRRGRFFLADGTLRSDLALE